MADFRTLKISCLYCQQSRVKKKPTVIKQTVELMQFKSVGCLEALGCLPLFYCCSPTCNCEPEACHRAHVDERDWGPSLIATSNLCTSMCICVRLVMQAPAAVSVQGDGGRSLRGRHLTFPALKEGLNLYPQLLQTRFRQPRQCLHATQIELKKKIVKQKKKILP